MGMFDYISCEYPLPVSTTDDVRKHKYQTKSLDCELNIYTITEDGRLLKREFDEDAPTSEETWKELDKYIGEVVFYGWPEKKSNPKRWLEFSAYFVHGKLAEFHLLQDHIDP